VPYTAPRTVWGVFSPNALGRQGLSCSGTRPYVETSAAELAGGKNETNDRQPCHAR
jgi:hypothetical protein